MSPLQRRPAGRGSGATTQQRAVGCPGAERLTERSWMVHRTECAGLNIHGDSSPAAAAASAAASRPNYRSPRARSSATVSDLSSRQQLFRVLHTDELLASQL